MKVKHQLREHLLMLIWSYRLLWNCDQTHRVAMHCKSWTHGTPSTYSPQAHSGWYCISSPSAQQQAVSMAQNLHRYRQVKTFSGRTKKTLKPKRVQLRVKSTPKSQAGHLQQAISNYFILLQRKTLHISSAREDLVSEVRAQSLYRVRRGVDTHAYINVQGLWGGCVLLHVVFVCAHTHACTHFHKGKWGMTMQWQEYHTYFPVRESLSLLLGRKTTSMT